MIQQYITEHVTHQALNDSRHAEILDAIGDDPKRFVLMSYDANGKKISTIPTLGSQLTKLYDDAEMSQLYEATTPVERIRLSRESLRNDIEPFRQYLDAEDSKVGTQLDTVTKKLLKYLDKVEKNISKDTGSTNIDL